MPFQAIKTITLKANPKLDAELTALAERLHTTKSAVIREAVSEYVAQLDREDMRKKLLAAPMLVREQNLEELEIWDETLMYGLDETEDFSEVLK